MGGWVDLALNSSASRELGKEKICRANSNDDARVSLAVDAGVVHWGFNYWHKLEREELTDPFNHSSAASYPLIPYGQPFMIYLVPDGKPIDSLCWEVFAESLQVLPSCNLRESAEMIRCWRASRAITTSRKTKIGSGEQQRRSCATNPRLVRSINGILCCRGSLAGTADCFRR
jgi:hypothetical protein